MAVCLRHSHNTLHCFTAIIIQISVTSSQFRLARVIGAGGTSNMLHCSIALNCISSADTDILTEDELEKHMTEQFLANCEDCQDL